MKFKLDENFSPTVQSFFQDKGLDCHTVQTEGLGGAADEQVLQAALDESRILVNMDHDFGNIFRYPPEKTEGIAVINPAGRSSGRSSRSLLQQLLNAFIEALQSNTIQGKLWIVEPGRIREHEPRDLPSGNGEEQ